ncbi:MAG: glycosyltransferase family 2 protein [Candidatus Saccharimonadales bacterium]
MKAAVVIPVFNESHRVLEVIDAAQNSQLVGEVVVNDGSTDDTLSVVNEVNDLTVLSHPYNLGKGEALDTGMRHVRDYGTDKAVFLDGDLSGIKPHHIDALLSPLDRDDVFMCIGYLGLRKTVIKKAILNKWGALSGQRAIRTEIWGLLDNQDKHGFNIEAALNARLRQHSLHRTISRVALENVGHVGKHDKLGSWPKAMWAYAKTYSAAMRTYARIEAARG